MARDAKIIQRGIDEQSNDLAVPAGTMVDSKNLSFDRDGVAARRTGHQAMWTGLPDVPLNAIDPLRIGVTRGEYDLFSGEVAFHLNQGMMFALDEIGSTDFWASVPVAMPHMTRIHGTWSGVNINQIGRMLAFCAGYGAADDGTELLAWQAPASNVAVFVGAIGNDSSAATSATAVQDVKFKTAFDALRMGDNYYISDETSIRISSLTAPTTTVFAGSITLAGTTDNTGAAARFTNATWMATDGSNLYVVDNGNAIRKITSAAVVTTLAGSVTLAGNTNAVGTAARFTNLSGLTYSGGFLYATEGATAHDIRKIDVTTGSVTAYAGTFGTSGLTNAVGTAARFNTPAGIEALGLDLYVGDTVNNVVRRIVISSASVTTFAGNSSAASVTGGLVVGSLATAILPSVTVRSIYSPTSVLFPGPGALAAQSICIECTAPNGSQDVGLIVIPSPTITNLATDQFVYHLGRTPNSLPTATTGPMKLDAWGFDTFSSQNVMAADTIGGAVFTTTEQPRVIDSYTRLNSTDPMPRMRQLGITAPEVPSCTTTSGTTFAANSAWAYRTLCGLKLTNGRIALGPPSERVIVTTGSQVAGSVTAFPSPGLPYDGLPFVQVYRTRTTAASTTDPGDTMFLCYEAPLSYGTGVVFTDSLPDELLGAELYTNQYAFGAASASLPPPAFANEVASFNQQCVLSNFMPAASCRIKVLGVSALVSGTSTLTLTTTGTKSTDACNTLTVNFNSAATDPSIKRAQISSAGSAAQNAVQTARNIVRVINRCADAMMFRAFYDENDPGSFVVYSQFPGRSRTVSAALSGGTLTNVQCSIGFSTNAATAFATIALNNSQRQINAIAPSDQGDVDSFPVINQVTCGASNEAIVRTLPLAENLLVVKDDNILRGDSSYNFEIYETALSCSLPNSFARLNNQWIGLFNAGFRALTSSQAVAIGRPIDRRVQNLYAAGSYFGTNDFASAAAVDRQGVYLCAFNKQVFAFSAYGGSAWGTFEMPYTNQPSWLGAHSDVFIPIISDYPHGVFRQSDYSNTTGFKNRYYDAAFYGTIASITASSAIAVTLDLSLAPLAASATDYSGAILYNVSLGADLGVVVSGAGTLLDPFVLNNTGLGNSAIGNSIAIYMPIEITAQYSPSLAPGVNSQFGDVGVTIERYNDRSGSITCVFYNRLDRFLTGDGSEYPYGQFSADQGIERVNVIAPTRTPESGLDSYLYYDFQRFATPADRSQDQVLAIKLTNRLAQSFIAIKGVVVDLSEGGKVKQ